MLLKKDIFNFIWRLLRIEKEAIFSKFFHDTIITFNQMQDKNYMTKENYTSTPTKT